jgi:hypothetical protein
MALVVYLVAAQPPGTPFLNSFAFFFAVAFAYAACTLS